MTQAEESKGWLPALLERAAITQRPAKVLPKNPNSLDDLAAVADAARRDVVRAQSELTQLDADYAEARRLQVEYLDKCEADYSEKLQACIEKNYERGIGSDMFKRELERIKSGKETT